MENLNILEQFEKTLKAQEITYRNNIKYSTLNEANDFYNKLLDEGIIKRRGYTLRGIEDAHLYQLKLNVNEI